MNMTLAKRQQQLLAYLQGSQPLEDADIHQHIVKQGKVDTAKRLGIYQNAYRQRLMETIDTDHNILGCYLGDDLYGHMMDRYIAQHPSDNFSLRHFAEQLPFFLNSQAPFDEHPQIAELARFERLLLSAFDAADSERANHAQLQSLPPISWPSMTLRFHPSVQLFISQWNVVEMWQFLKAEQVPPDPVEATNIWVLWRNDERLTEFKPMDNIAHQMMNLFQQGKDFSEVCEALLEFLPEQQVSERAVNILLTWLKQGLVQAIKTRQPG